jgi:protein-tyrosine phosphatase
MSRILRWARGSLSSRRRYSSWSQVSPSILVGPALDRAGYVELAERGVTHVIDLRAEGSPDPDRAKSIGMNWLGVPVVDRHPPTDAQFEHLADWLRASGPDAIAYIHCQGGLQRSPTVAIALLIRAGYGLAEAHAAVARAHPLARPTPAQENWLSHVAASSRQSFPSSEDESRSYTHRPNSSHEQDAS